MLDEDLGFLVASLRGNAKAISNIPYVQTMKVLMMEAADALEILKKENDRLERLYAKDMICGSYVSRDALMRQFLKWEHHSYDGRGDIKSLSALLYGLDTVSKEEAMVKMMDNGGREFRIWTPKGDLKVQAKSALDDPSDFPGVYIDLIRHDGHDLLCCVEYDSVADGLYARVYADGDEPSESVRFENADEEE